MTGTVRTFCSVLFTAMVSFTDAPTSWAGAVLGVIETYTRPGSTLCVPGRSATWVTTPVALTPRSGSSIFTVAPGRTSLASLGDSDESIARRELLTVITRPATLSPRRTRTESTRSGKVGK